MNSTVSEVKITSTVDFLTQLVKLSHIGLIDGEKTAEFHVKTKSLLEYIHSNNDAELALLLTQTLVHIQDCSKFYVVNNATNLRLICDFIFIQFKTHKVEIYNNVFKIITHEDDYISKSNINTIVAPLLQKLDANLYECFNLNLSVKLLDTYFIYDEEAFKNLFYDLLMDWEQFGNQINEETFEKLVWYAFVLNEEDYLKRKIVEYNVLLKADKWNLKFYRYIRKHSRNGALDDRTKLLNAINKFKKNKVFSDKATEKIAKKIYLIFPVNDTKKAAAPPQKNEEKVNQKSLQNKKEIIDPVRALRRLSPYNLPNGVKLGSINKEKTIHLAVYEDKSMEKIKRVIQVKALQVAGRTEYYVNKKTLKAINKEVDTTGGYIHIIDNKKNKGGVKKEETNMFAWPSTEISGMGLGTDARGLELSEISALRRMGYQITDTSREQRWMVLQRAVPALGLKKVADTLARNVRLKKGQKNGKKKFAYAISEWENDLRKLKDKYYKRDFNWPRT
ncbi:hypothetical protein ACWE42_19290 [Sutcliffiella cohnii]